MPAEHRNDGTQTGNDALHQSLTENRHLMAMIAAMRTELEEAMRQLRDTISSLLSPD